LAVRVWLEKVEFKEVPDAAVRVTMVVNVVSVDRLMIIPSNGTTGVVMVQVVGAAPDQ